MTSLRPSEVRFSETVSASDVLALARRLIGSERGTQRWLNTEHPLLGGRTPQSLLEGGQGRRVYELLLGQSPAGEAEDRAP